MAKIEITKTELVWSRRHELAVIRNDMIVLKDEKL